ncbi:MAG: HTTM domain-containing protein, partial [Woeseiaceae bacterium]|nr:HTTM domain-containing protein [Woeseiaceae bacterium]
IVTSYIYLALKRRTTKISTSEMFEIFGPVGRWLLIIMYFFGTFHKINPGFLSPLSSCALPFVNGFPLPGSVLGSPWVQYAAIYGTLILESIAMLMLLSARTKYFGMLLGMSFHFIIGISGYGTLAHFSAFALSLHAQFLPSDFGQRIFAEKRIPAALKSEANFRVLTVLLVAAQLAFAVNLAITRDGFIVNLLFAMFALILFFLVFKHGQVRSSTAPYTLKSPLIALNLVPVWFFVHCMSPYLGLGTGGALTMFSGLRTEGGISNHYIITKPLHLFTYQDKVVYFEEATNSNLQDAAAGEQGLVMFDFQRHFTYRQTLQLPLTLRIGDEILPINDVESFNAFVNAHFEEQSWLERKYLSFRLVDTATPNQCRH